MSVLELAREMVATKDLRALPTPDEPALQLADRDKRRTIEEAYAKVAPMFWGARISLDEACAVVREWLAEQGWIR